ncbi:MAG: energy transducer TonB [Pseudomonadota bacterium]|nr:energy transducer TonB [Pseudomonadota bacterium]
MKFIPRTAGAVSLIVIVAGHAVAAEAGVMKRRDTERWFGKDGVATDYGKRAASEQGLPPLVSGVWVEMMQAASAKLVDKIYVTRKAPCATVQFKIKADGTTDQFAVVTSSPNDGYGKNVVQSMLHWKFAPGPADRWETMVVDFEESDQLTGSRLVSDLACSSLSTQVTHVLAESRKLLDSRPPLYPGDLAASKTAGCATIRFTVRPDGLADSYEVINSTPGESFVSAAAQTLNAWRFEPAKEASLAAVQFSFAIEGSTAAPDCAWPFTSQASRTGIQE